MPTYDYQCSVCGYTIEHTCRIADRPEAMPCDLDCPGEMRQIISFAPPIQCDDAVNVPWIREFAETRPEARLNQRTGQNKAKTIETRTEYHKYLKERDLRPASGPNLSEV